MRFPNGDVYRGMWRRGKRHGQGTYMYSNGDSYSGQWRNGKRHGRGTYIARDTGSQVRSSATLPVRLRALTTPLAARFRAKYLSAAADRRVGRGKALPRQVDARRRDAV